MLQIVLKNLYTAGMVITSDRRERISIRNTVGCPAQEQATGTTATLCAEKKCGTCDIKYNKLRKSLDNGGVYF